MCVTLNARNAADSLQIAVHKLEIFTAKYGLKNVNMQNKKTVLFCKRKKSSGKDNLINCNVIIITKKIQIKLARM